MDETLLLVADRSERGKLRLTGPQRSWFLHQILTQSFEDMRAGDARDAAMITAHGRMVGYMEAVATDDAILLHFEAEQRSVLPAEIERYVFATQVVIEDVSDRMGLILVAGADWENAVGALAASAVTHPSSSLGLPAAYLWVDHTVTADVIARLLAVGADPATERELERIRIRSGVPRWGHDMDARTFPQEVGIDGRAVHYDKGCYVGQEAMAKIHFRGKVNRRLARIEAEQALRAGTDVMVDGARVGIVTSAAGRDALALVRHTVDPGAEVRVDGVKAALVG